MTGNRGATPYVRPRSRRSIEADADQLVSRFYPRHSVDPLPIPVEHLLEVILPREFDIDFWVDADLPAGVEAVAKQVGSLGRPAILFSPDTYDALWKRQPRARFTAGHEVAHALYHLNQLHTQIVEGRSPVFYRRREIPAYADPEWQSHVFAGTLLMPTRAVLAHVQLRGDGPASLADVFKVSRQAAETRLHYLRKGGLITGTP